MVESIDKLVVIGTEIIVMPANSPHYAVSFSVPFCPVPFVDIIETTVVTCVERAYSLVAVLGIGIIMSEGLYTEALAKQRISRRNMAVKVGKVIVDSTKPRLPVVLLMYSCLAMMG